MLMALDWSERFIVGDVKVDQEHREWFRLANSFLLASDLKAQREAGHAFVHYTHQHFAHEETFMREMNFPFISTHIQEHESLSNTLAKVLDFDVVFDANLSKTELEEFVSYCLTKHITRFDAPLQVFIKQCSFSE
jgi:hemerythrin-like metal-binding protein